MKLQAIQLSVRILGTAFGIIGVSLVGASLLSLAGLSFGSTPLSRGWAIFWVLFGTAFCRTGYLVWFRWSPMAIRHVVGDAFFFIMLFCLFHVPFHVPAGWGLSSFLAAIPVCYTLYLLITHLLSCRAFPVTSHATRFLRMYGAPLLIIGLAFAAFGIILRMQLSQ